MRESVDPNPVRRTKLATRVPTGVSMVLKDELVERVSFLIEQARKSIASYANTTLTLTYWQVGSLIDAEVLGGERADYGAQILVTLSHKLSWSHFLVLLPLRSDDARNFYTLESAARAAPDTFDRVMYTSLRVDLHALVET